MVKSLAQKTLDTWGKIEENEARTTTATSPASNGEAETQPTNLPRRKRKNVVFSQDEDTTAASATASATASTTNTVAATGYTKHDVSKLQLIVLGLAGTTQKFDTLSYFKMAVEYMEEMKKVLIPNCKLLNRMSI